MANINDLRYFNGIGVDWLTNDTLYGTEFDDRVEVHGGNDFFNDIAGGNDIVYDISAKGGGYSGNDVVSTGLGNDTVFSSLDSQNSYYGGLGTDKLDLIGSKTGARVDLAWGTAQNASGLVSQIVGFENLSGSHYADVLYGDSAANTINGGYGNDLIDGRAGNDTLYGDIGIGISDDQLFGGADNDFVYGGSGNDGVYGGDGTDWVYGDHGNDRVSGGAGDDYLFGGDHNDIMLGDAGNDSIWGGNHNDVMYGGIGIDGLSGGAGNDVLEGGLGNDQLVGNAGNDRFVFRTLADSFGNAIDHIYDFQRGLDKIDVSLIDARATLAGNQAFTFIGTGNFTTAGQIKTAYSAAQGTTSVLFNTDSDSSAEMLFTVAGNVTLAAGDFIL